MVKPVWEQHVANMNTQERLQMGETTLKSEYDNVVKTYLKEMAKRSRTAIETITKSSQKAPHMESRATRKAGRFRVGTWSIKNELDKSRKTDPRAVWTLIRRWRISSKSFSPPICSRFSPCRCFR